MRGLRISALMFLSLLWVASATYAQDIFGTISGIVKDSSGGVLPGTSITVKNLDTSILESAVTDADGRFAVRSLSLGTYEVQAMLEGFQAQVRSGITLTIGREALVNFVLGLGTISDQIIVVGDAPLVQPTSGTIAGLVDEKTIRELPLNSRDLLQLADLQPGVAVSRSSGTGQSVGFGVQLSIGGARPNENTFLLDGQTLNDHVNQAPASVSGAVLGVDSVKEFEVLTSSYSAQYGRNAGGVISAVTRSGTNQFSGSAFDFIRRDGLDKANYFDQAGNKPTFHRDQFGGTLGGPLVRDRTFFFGSYEGLRQVRGQTLSSRFLTADARQGILPTGRVTVNPIMQPYIALYPIPQAGARDFGDGTAEYISIVSDPVHENYGMLRLDQNWASGHNMSGRYSISTAAEVEPSVVGFQTGGFQTKREYYVLEQRDSFTQNALNTVRFGFSNSPLLHKVTQAKQLDASLLFVPGQPLLGSGGPPLVTGINIEPRGNAWYKLAEVTDSFTLVRGSHSLGIGGQLQYILDDSDRVFVSTGNYTFTTISNWLQGIASSLETIVPPSDTLRHIRQTYVGTYLQDRWQVTPNITLDLGLRYETATVPEERDGKSANVIDLQHDTKVTTGPIWKNPTKLSFAPRVGGAWNVGGSGRTVIRGGFGKFYDMPMSILSRWPMARLPPYFISQTATGGVPFPGGLAFIQSGQGNLGSGTRLDTTTYNLRNTYLYQYNVTGEREIRRGGVVTASFIGSRGYNLPIGFSEWNQNEPVLRDGRLFWIPNTPRRNPAWGNVRYRDTIGRSIYDSLSVGFSQRLNTVFQVRTSYAWGRTMDDGANVVVAGEAEGTLDQPWDLSLERGPSPFDLGHNFNLSGVLLLPFGENSSGITRALINGWQVNGVFRAAAGQPFSVSAGLNRTGWIGRAANGDGQRPDLAPGADPNPVLGGASQYFDPNAFVLQPVGYYGNLGRNTLLGPGLQTLDMSFVKNNSLGGKRNLQVRIETFNLLNHVNWGSPATAIFTGTGARNATAGRITSTKTSARQVQIGLKFTF